MNEPTRSPLWQALGLAWEFGYTIALPLVLFGLAGAWADRHFGTSPWALLGGMVLAILITTVALVRRFRRLLNDIDKNSPS